MQTIKVMTVYVRAEKGCGRIKAEFPIGGSKIFFAVENHILRRDGVAFQVPAGVAYVRNRELAERTNGKVVHEMVEEGLHHLRRMAIHIVRNNTDEIAVMYARRVQIGDEAKSLLLSGMMSDEEHASILRELEVLEAQFSPPKRVEQKLTAAKHLGKAHALRASGDRRKIAPSSMTAYAAGKRVSIRISDLGFIRKYFSGEALKLSEVIHTYRVAVKNLSEFFEPPQGDRRGPRTHGAFFRFMEGLGIPAGHKHALVMLRRQLGGHAATMEGLTYMPYREVCRRIVVLLGDIDAALVRGVYAAAYRTADVVRRLLRQIRMIDEIETTVVAPISIYLKRMPANIQSPDDPDQIAFRAQFKKVADGIKHRRSPTEFHPRVLVTVLDLLGEAEEHITDPKKAKEILKDLTAALAKDPYDVAAHVGNKVA